MLKYLTLKTPEGASDHPLRTNALEDAGGDPVCSSQAMVSQVSAHFYPSKLINH